MSVLDAIMIIVLIALWLIVASPWSNHNQ